MNYKVADSGCDSCHNPHGSNKSGILYALDSQGNEKWRFSIDGQINRQMMLTSGGNILFSDNQQNIYSVNQSGSLSWQKQFENLLNASFSSDNNGNIFVSSNNGAFAIDEQGNQLWSNNSIEYIYHSFVVSEQGDIVGQSTNGTVYSLNATTGQVNWSYHTTPTDIVYAGTSISKDGSTLITDGKNMLISLDNQGQIRWRKNIAKSLNTGAAISEDGTIYIASQHYGLIAIKNDQQPANSGWYSQGGNRAHTYRAPASQNNDTPLEPNTIMSWLKILIDEGN